MNVFLLILAGIILIILLLLLCPFSIKIVYDEKVHLSVGYFFPVFRIPLEKKEITDPKKLARLEKKKQKKEEKKKRREEKQRIKEEKQRMKLKAQGKELPEKKQNFIAGLIKKEGLSGLIDLLNELVSILAGLMKKITDHLVISKMDLQIALGSEDAAHTAVLYGQTCSAVYPLINIISSHVKKCRHRERIAPVFTSEKTRIRFILQARIQPFFILSGAVRAGLRFLKTMLSNKSAAQPQSSER